MKFLYFAVAACLAVSGCRNSVKQDAVHGNLLGVWKMKYDAFVVQHDGVSSRLLIVPCNGENTTFLPYGNWQYEEEAFGRELDGTRIVGGVRRNQSIVVIDVLKDSDPIMGTTYIPVVNVLGGMFPANRKLDGFLLYRGFYNEGILNPAFAKRVE